MVQMSQPVLDEYLHTPRYAVFGTNSADGPPQLTTVWFLYEDGYFYFDIARRAVKCRNLTRDPRVAACVDDEHPGGRSVTVYGRAEVIEQGTPEVDEIVWRLMRRYHESDEETETYREVELAQDMVLIKVTPDRIVALDQAG